MGIPYYFKSLIKKHPECLKTIKNKIPSNSNTKLYLDFNCAIHRNLSGDSDKERILNILKTLDDILSNFDSPRYNVDDFIVNTGASDNEIE